MRRALCLLKGLAIGLALVVLGVALLLGYWYVRANTATVEAALGLETWVAVSDGTHNSNTDLIYWKDAFYLVHATSPWHFASSQTRLRVLRSADGHTWERLAELDVPDQDVRDPKFASIGDRLFLYALKNRALTAEPYGTAVASSDDGRAWSPLQDVEPQGWLFWRPKTRDGGTWYAPAYWHEHGRAVLLKSTDGIHWEEVSTIYSGDRADETAIEFMPDGSLLATARLEVSDSIFGHRDAATLVAVASPPYAQWRYARSSVTRLDGPSLFSYQGRVFAVGRAHVGPHGPLTRVGSIFGRKRTALYLVTPDGLVHLSDLPSAGDTSYAGSVIRGDDLYISYYTSRTDRDWPWILGMLLPSEIRMARVPLPQLLELAAGNP
ncbi:MAG: exo-alpha-sialidase [Bacillota bacterium]|nr:MAG: exo-alpha-sialidase [Bacillota bacterium]